MKNQILTPIEEALISKGNFIVRRNLLTDSKYTPYCGAYSIQSITEGNGKVSCSLPRTVFDGQQFVCPECGYRTEFPEDFISYYKQKWNK